MASWLEHIQLLQVLCKGQLDFTVGSLAPWISGRPKCHFPPQPHLAACQRNISLAGTPLRHRLQRRPLVLGPQLILRGANKCDTQSFSLLMQSGAGVERWLLHVRAPHSDPHRGKRVDQPSSSGSIGICELPVYSEHLLPMHCESFRAYL